MEERDLAYIAGFVDGEGTILISHKSDNYYQVVVQITNTNEAILDWISSILPAQNKALQQRDNPNHKPVYRLQYTGVTVRWFLMHVTPYLKLKREIAELCQEFLGMTPLGEKPRLTEESIEQRETLYKKVKHLNKRGVA